MKTNIPALPNSRAYKFWGVCGDLYLVLPQNGYWTMVKMGWRIFFGMPGKDSFWQRTDHSLQPDEPHFALRIKNIK